MNASGKTRIVVVGGGTGGMAAIAALMQWPGRDKLDITLLEPSDFHYYQPQWTMVGAGLFPREVTRKPMATLIPEGELDQSGGGRVRPGGQSRGDRRWRSCELRFLIVAAGLVLDWHKIEGLEGNLGKHGLCSNYSYDTVESTWRTIRELRSGTALFTFPPPPSSVPGRRRRSCTWPRIISAAAVCAPDQRRLSLRGRRDLRGQEVRGRPQSHLRGA